jgi:hypothetical protein
MANNFLSIHPVIMIVAGLALLVLGRKLFWLSVGVVGFLAGLWLALQWLNNEPMWLVIVIAVAVGFVGAILAIVAQKIAVGLAGFLLGGYAAAWLVYLVGLHPAAWAWILLIGGGIIGAVLALSLLEPALIGLTAVAGASLVVQAINTGPVVSALVFVVLLAVGVVIQVKTLPEKHEVSEQRDE